MESRLRQSVSGLALAAFGLGAPGIAFAQDQELSVAAEEEVGSDNSENVIIVTAQKRAENLNEVPLSIQAFGGDQLSTAGITDASGLSVVTPGLNVARSSANTPIFTLRGVGFNTPNLSSTSPVGIYVDEVAYAYPYMANGPTFDIERVEVLKGPQGTLYGRNTTGGLVNFITNKPSDEFEGGISVELGNRQTYNFEGFLNLPISDTLGLRVAGRWENSDEGWQNSVTRDDKLGEKDRLGLRATLLWEPSPAVTVTLSGSYWRDKSDTIAGQAVLLNPDAPPFVDPRLAGAIRDDWTSTTADWDPEDGSKPPFRVDSDFLSLSARVDVELSDTLSLTSLTGFNDVNRSDQNDLDGTAIEVFTLESFGGIESFSQELRLSGEAGPLSFIVGGYYSNDDIIDSQNGYYDRSSILQFLRFLSQNVIDPNNLLHTPEEYSGGFRLFRNISEQQSRSISVFASGDLELSDSLTLSAGLRYTDDRLEFNACSTDFDGNTFPIWNTAVQFVVNAQTGAVPNFTVGRNECLTFATNFVDLASFEREPLEEDNVAGRISLKYEASDDLLVYGTVSRGFKSGSVPVLPTNVETQLEPARQEQVTTYELGAKATLFGGVGQLNVAGFYYDYKDKQLFAEVLDPVFTTLTRLVNIPESEVFGGELDLTLFPTDSLTLRTGIAYTETEVTRFQGFDRLGQPADFAGSSFPYTPKWQINGSVNYDTPLNEDMELRASINANYQSSTSGSLGREDGFELRAYTVVNANISVHEFNSGVTVGLWANNLFDEYYWTATDVLTDVVFRIPGLARTYGLRVGVEF